MKMPGFSAESSLYKTRGYYQSVSTRRSGSGKEGAIPQMRAGWPFSGSCGCGPGYCCCELCWFNSCTFWCW
jgi:hypothetical protein